MSQDIIAGQDPVDEHTNQKWLRTVRLIVIGNLIALQVLLLCVALLEAAHRDRALGVQRGPGAGGVLEQVAQPHAEVVGLLGVEVRHQFPRIFS